jgi:signal transduction histidine kinase
MCTNLVKNAIEASPAQGLVRISAEVHEGSVQVSVDDEGDGVAAAHQARLYEPFFTTREKSGGTGLGLAVTHGLALAQGGTTGYAPRTPRGSRFWFEVPLANKPS